MDVVSNASSDRLLNRVIHHMKRNDDMGMSASKVANRLREKDVAEVRRRLDYLVGKGLLRKRDAGTVYNGLPVVMYQWGS